jgi:hypothetical protein
MEKLSNTATNISLREQGKNEAAAEEMNYEH